MMKLVREASKGLELMAARFLAYRRDVRRRWLDYVIVLGIFVVVYIAIVVYYPQYYHDSAHYLARSLWYSGMSRQEAFDVVYNMHVSNGWEPTASIGQLFDWGLVAPRVVYPLIATPLVWAFGAKGMIATSALITVVLLASIYAMLANHYGRVAAIVSLLLTESSFLIMVFFAGMLTEALSALWTLAALAAAYRYQRDPSKRWIVWMVVLTLLSAFTRQATLIVAGAFIMAWLLSRFTRPSRGWGIPALAVAATSVATQIVQTWLFPFSQGDQYMRMTGTDTLWGALRATPSLARDILAQELRSYAMHDQVLFAIIGLALISMVVMWRHSESHLLLGGLLATALYTITNGNSTDFRYALPGLIFFLSSIALLVQRLIQLQVPVGARVVGAEQADEGGRFAPSERVAGRD